MSVSTRIPVQAYLDGDWPPNSQLIEGEVVVNDPAVRHQRVVLTIVGALRDWTRAEPGRGEAGIGCNWVIPVGANVYKPDVWWVTDEHRPADEAIWLETVPDLAVEVRSPGTWRYDIGAKRSAYERARLPELWLVDTAARTVIVYRRPTATTVELNVALELAQSDVLTSPLLTGFELPLADLFGSGGR